jgi:hypothetical protein
MNGVTKSAWAGAIVVLLAAIGMPSPSAAQGAPGDDSRAAREAQRPAPLADVDDVEPAVDVGGRATNFLTREAPAAPVARPPAAPGAPAAPAAPAARAAETPQPVPAAPASRTAAAPPRAATAGVMDTLDLGTTSITGNQELPKVLYIVPWKKSDLGDLVGRPVNTLLDEVLAPVDPEVFERHLDYYETLYGEAQEE